MEWSYVNILRQGCLWHDGSNSPADLIALVESAFSKKHIENAHLLPEVSCIFPKNIENAHVDRFGEGLEEGLEMGLEPRIFIFFFLF